MAYDVEVGKTFNKTFYARDPEGCPLEYTMVNSSHSDLRAKSARRGLSISFPVRQEGMYLHGMPFI